MNGQVLELYEICNFLPLPLAGFTALAQEPWAPSLFCRLPALADLAAAWWTVFIHNAVLQEHQFLIEGLEYRGRMYAFLMGYDSEHQPQPGIYAQDSRMEIVRIADQQTPYRFPLRPYWPELAIQPSPVYLQSIERKFQSRSFMVQGEGSLLGLLILVSSFMLYRLISVERRSARELREFWSRSTHEIKTPITGLKAFLQTLKTRDLNRQELQPLVDMALEQVERQQQLAQNILLGQRMERDLRDLPREPIRLADFVGRFLDSHSSLLSRCRVDFDPAGWTDVVVSADPNSLHVILDNLTDNALKYGGDQPHIQVGCSLRRKRLPFCSRTTAKDSIRGWRRTSSKPTSVLAMSCLRVSMAPAWAYTFPGSWRERWAANWEPKVMVWVAELFFAPPAAPARFRQLKLRDKAGLKPT